MAKKVIEFRRLSNERLIQKYPFVKEWVKPGREFGEAFAGDGEKDVKNTFPCTIVDDKPSEFLEEGEDWFPCPQSGFAYVEVK